MQSAQTSFYEPSDLVTNGVVEKDQDSVVEAAAAAAPATKEKPSKSGAGRPRKEKGDAAQKPRSPYQKPLKAEYIDAPRPLEFADGLSSMDYVLGWIYHHVIQPLGLQNELEMAESLIAQSFIQGMAKQQTERVQRFKLLQQVRQFKALGEENPERAAVALFELQGRLKELRSAKPLEEAK